MDSSLSPKPWHIRDVDLQKRNDALSKEEPWRIAPYKGKMFFINKKLHRRVKINKSIKLVSCYDYESGKLVNFSYSDFKKFRQRALLISEASKILRRNSNAIRYAIYDKSIPSEVPRVFRKNGVGIYYLSEDHIFELRDYFASKHRGRPRKDGLIVSKNVPTIEELEVFFGRRQVLYTRTKEGEFVPVWRSENFDI
jgi:hypothetical protein